MQSNTIRVGAVQHKAGPTREQSWASSERHLQRLAASGTQIAVLQELHSTEYFCRTVDPAHFEKAEPVPGPTSGTLATWARRYKMVIVGSVFERRAPGIYHNTALVFDNDGTLAGRYRKMHIPDDPGYSEKYYFSPGEKWHHSITDAAFRPVPTSIGSLGVLVCWDQWFPEAARLMALAGADLLIYPSAIGSSPDDTAGRRARERDAWITVQRGHAIANQLPLIAVNRVGFEQSRGEDDEGIHFWGSSFISGPMGEMLAQAPEDAEAEVSAELTIGGYETLRQEWPFFRDRRIDAYGGLMNRWRDQL